MTATAIKKITLTINGKEVSIPEGGTILDAAKALNIEIPTLCHNSSLAPYGSCWICAVKVEGARSLVPSCSTKVSEGMKVITNDDEVMQTRKLCLELLLSDHYGDCLGPCQMTCPAGIDVQGYIAHIAKGEYGEALRLIKQKNPLPLICGRVCPRPCEDECRRNIVDEPVAVDALKRFVADIDRARGEESYIPPVAESTGKKVAVIGGGPAGLTCAYYLAQRGHEVKIFDALPSLGGMLRWGIPAYRLPRDVLDDEINNILKLGIDVEYNKRLGKDYTIDSLKKDGFDAVFLGIGATTSRSMRVDGEDKEGVMSGTDFLRDFGLGKEFDFTGKNVAVIGGGNTAIDAARTSLRLGADEVTIIYRRSRAEMPAEDIEVKDAEEEGVKFKFLAAPTKVLGDSKLSGIEFVKMELGEPDESGRRRPVEVKGSEETLDLDIVIAAIGQVPELDCIENTDIEKTPWGSISASEKSLATQIDSVFAGGDCVNGAATVVEAVAHGREGAISIDAYLNGRNIERRENIFNIDKGKWKELDPADFEHFLKTKRQHMSCMAIADRISGFDEVEKGISEDQAMIEANRCLECGCSDALECRVRGYATEYDIDTSRFGGDSRKEDPDERHPIIRHEMQKCIMCGACVRTCDEVHNVRAIGFTGRGFSARVRPAFGESLLDAGCISCGSCVDVCPTGAITEKLGKTGGPFHLTQKESVCSGCSVGCIMENNFSSSGDLISIQPQSKDLPDAPNRGQFCIRGHFANHLLKPEYHILNPMLKKDGALVEVTYKEALEKAASILQGGEETAFLISEHSPQEEVAAVASLAEKLGSKICGSLDMLAEENCLSGIEKVTGSRTSPKTVSDIIASDCLVLVESDPIRSHHVAGVQALAARRMGAELITISTSNNSCSEEASLNIRAKENTVPAVLSGLISELLNCTDCGSFSKDDWQKMKDSFSSIDLDGIEKLSDVTETEIKECAEKLKSADSPLIIIDSRIAGENLAQLSALLSGVIANNVEDLPLMVLRSAANSNGLTRAGLYGVEPATLSGKVVFSLREDINAAGVKDCKALIILDAMMSDSVHDADVVIPVPSLFEIEGKLFATGGLEGKLQGKEKPLAGMEAKESMQKLFKLCGEEINMQMKKSEKNMSAAIPENLLIKEALQKKKKRTDSFTRTFIKWATENKLILERLC